MNSDLPIVRQLLSAGHGDRHIAATLGVTRHRARSLMREAERSASIQVVALAPAAGSPSRVWAARIAACWQASVRAILEVGRLLSQAKQDLPHGSFGKMIESDLPFGARTAQMLMAIAADNRLSDTKHVSHLPASWGTLYELTKLDDDQFERKIADGTIRADMERQEIAPKDPDNEPSATPSKPHTPLPNGARSIMGSRQEPDDSLDFFPTPPYATRALVERVLPQLGIQKIETAWEPACGEGHIAGVLQEYGTHVYATDIFDYETTYQDRLCNFLDTNDYAPVVKPGRYEWVITNPPFGDKAIQFVLRGLEYARVGVAMFFRSQWAVEGKDRYEKLFRDRPPTLCAFFVERVNLRRGHYDHKGSTATAYCWLVWMHGENPRAPFWIPPGCRKDLTRPEDAQRFAPAILEESDSTGTPLQHDPSSGEIVEREGVA